MPKKQDKPVAPVKAKRAPVDYARIEPGWRAGIKSVLQLAADYERDTGQSVSHTAIKKHFDKLGIARDLAAKVQAKAEALVSAAAVSAQVESETGRATTATEAAIINANADIVAGVVLSQRKDIQRNRALVMQLLGELEGVTNHGDKLEAMADILIGDVDPGDILAKARRDKMMDALNKALSLNGRVDSMKKLADTLKVLVGLEREAFGIEGAGDKGKGGRLEDWLDSI